MTATTATPRMPSRAGRYSNETGDAGRVLVLNRTSAIPPEGRPDVLTPPASLLPGSSKRQETPGRTVESARRPGRWLGSERERADRRQRLYRLQRPYRLQRQGGLRHRRGARGGARHHRGLDRKSVV